MAIIGLRNLHFALLEEDTKEGVLYDVPEMMAAAISASITPEVSSATLYANDVAIATSSNLGSIQVELEIDQLAPEVIEKLLGVKRNEDGVLVYDGDATSPYVAIGFQAELSTGGFRYVWLTKGQFSIPADSYQTKGESVEFQTKTISATFLTREHDRVWKYEVNEDKLQNPEITNNWFKNVYEPTAA